MQKKIRKAIIPAAGFGTRFLPATKSQPKEMLPIVDKPTIQYIVEEAIDSGIENILIVTGRYKSSIADHFDRSVELEMELEKKGKTEMLAMVKKIANMVNIQFIRQGTALGLGHAVLCTRNFINDEPFAVLLGDDIVDSPGNPCLKQMIEKYEEYQCSVIGVQSVKKSEIPNYGVVSGEKITDTVYKLDKLVEKPKVEDAPSDLAIMGRYILTPDIFEVLEKTQFGANHEIQLTDALNTFAAEKSVISYTFSGKRHDAGNKLEFIKATIDFALQRPDLKDGLMQYLKEIVAGN